MLILVGETGMREFVARLEALGWGRLWCQGRPTPYPGEPWAIDNGAFRAWLHRQPFPAAEFERRVAIAERVGSPALAVLPDIVAGGLESLEFSLSWLERLPPRWPWYLAVQDGMRPEEVASELAPVAGIFLGGTTRFKATALLWARLAHAHGKRFHFARAGTLARVELARRVWADSLDSSFPLWTRERFDTFVSCVLYGRPGIGINPLTADLLFPIHDGEYVESATAALAETMRRAGRASSAASPVATAGGGASCGDADGCVPDEVPQLT